MQGTTNLPNKDINTTGYPPCICGNGINKPLYIELKNKAHSWQALHKKAVERREKIKNDFNDYRKYTDAKFNKTVTALKNDAYMQIKQLQEQITNLNHQLESTKAQLLQYKKMIFGKKNEKNSNKVTKATRLTRRRGQRKGARGHGRNIIKLPVKEEFIELPHYLQQCPQCFLPYSPISATEDSEIIEISVNAHKRILKRMKYKKHSCCACQRTPKLLTAPIPPKCIPKGKLGSSVYANLLVNKFGLQIPLYRSIKILAQYGIILSQGAVTGAFKFFMPLFEPVYQGIIKRSQRGKHWHVDETGWKVFKKIPDKKNYQWYLWVYHCKQATVYTIAPSRATAVPEAFFSKINGGWISCDRYTVYQKLAPKHRLQIAYCWIHMRRDFFNISTSYPKLSHWAWSWINKINELFSLNKQRVKLYNTNGPHWNTLAILEDKLAQMEERAKKQLENPNLHEAAKKVLIRMQKYWSGLTTFLYMPEIPMDNNPAESALRGPVVGRKNYYGSGSVWSAHFTAMMFSIIETLKLHDINPTSWLTHYLDACAIYNNKPPWHIIDKFLPWNMNLQQKLAFAVPAAA